MKDAAERREDLLRIFMFASPKTGNNWLSLLLSRVYKIPQTPIAFDCEWIDEERIDKGSVRLKDLPDMDCVGYEHLWPGADLVRRLEAENIHVLSLVRHPADAFLSLYHYVNRRKNRPATGKWHELLENRKLDDDDVYRFLERYFYLMFIERGLGWMETGKAIIVRYEDLRLDTKNTLRAVTNRIRPVEEDRIDEAVRLCTLERMKTLNKGLSVLCRKGEVGEWRKVLNEMHLRIMGRHDYELRAMGYSLSKNTIAESLARIP